MADTPDTPEAVWQRIQERTVTQCMEAAPTRPGLYLAPDGYAYVELLGRDVDVDVVESWRVLGDPKVRTRREVAENLHGPNSWQRLYTATELADEIRVAAERIEVPVGEVIDHILASGALPE